MRFFTKQINPRSFGSWCVKGTEESTSRLDSSVALTHHGPKDLELICLVKKRKIHFRILSDFRVQSWIFLKKHTLSRWNRDLGCGWSRDHISIQNRRVGGYSSTFCREDDKIPHPSSRFFYHLDSGWSRDQPQPGSLFQRLREAEKRDPGNEVVIDTTTSCFYLMRPSVTSQQLLFSSGRTLKIYSTLQNRNLHANLPLYFRLTKTTRLTIKSACQ